MVHASTPHQAIVAAQPKQKQYGHRNVVAMILHHSNQTLGEIINRIMMGAVGTAPILRRRQGLASDIGEVSDVIPFVARCVVAWASSRNGVTPLPVYINIVSKVISE